MDEAPLLENVSEMDEPLYMEAALARGKSWKNRLFALLGVVIAALGLMLGGNWLVTLLGLAVTLLAWFSPLIIGRRDLARLKARCAGDRWQKTVRFYSDRIETCSASGATTTARYRDIRREYESEHMYVIDYGRTCPATAFRKDGFTIGDLAQMKALLLERQRESFSSGREV